MECQCWQHPPLKLCVVATSRANVTTSAASANAILIGGVSTVATRSARPAQMGRSLDASAAHHPTFVMAVVHAKVRRVETLKQARANAAGITTMVWRVKCRTVEVARVTRINALARAHANRNRACVCATRVPQVVIAHFAGTASTNLALPNAVRQDIVIGLLGSVFATMATTMAPHARNHAAMRHTTQIGAAVWTSGAGLCASLVG